MEALHQHDDLFLSRLDDAEKLRGSKSENGIQQVVLRFRTRSLIEIGCDLRVCKWNNGYPDRSKPPRLRAFSDYRPIETWKPGDKVQEVTVAKQIPTSVAFDVLT